MKGTFFYLNVKFVSPMADLVWSGKFYTLLDIFNERSGSSKFNL